MRHRVRSADAGDLTSADVEKRRADHKSCWRCVGIRVAWMLGPTRETCLDQACCWRVRSAGISTRGR